MESLRLAVYESFASTGRPPEVDDLMRSLRMTATDVRTGLRTLHDARHVVLGDDGRIVMAHPFSAIPLGFSVMGDETLWWGGCAWDSFALPHLLPGVGNVLVVTRCPACGSPHAWNVTDDAPPEGDQLAHFLVPVARMWDDVFHTCGNQRIFCEPRCIEDWLTQTANDEGSVMDLATLWRLASGWYAGRLDRGYVRRDPSAAAAYFADVGLSGPFWGLPERQSH